MGKLIPQEWAAFQSDSAYEWFRQQLHTYGGSVIQYRRIISFVLHSVVDDRLVWIPPGFSRARGGMKDNLLSLLFGWWSIVGVLMTPVVILGNLMGGINVTAIFSEPNMDESQLRATPAYREFIANKRRHYAFVIGYLLLVLAITGYFAVEAMLGSQ